MVAVVRFASLLLLVAIVCMIVIGCQPKAEQAPPEPEPGTTQVPPVPPGPEPGMPPVNAPVNEAPVDVGD
ncbi:MAG: hypothetical protein AB7Y46_10840 [Armatimonadota bacterium]